MIGSSVPSIMRKLFGNEKQEVADTLDSYAFAVYSKEQLGLAPLDQSKLAEAETMFHEVVAIRKKVLGETDPKVAWALDHLGLSLELEHKLAESVSVHREALALRRKLFGNENQAVDQSLKHLAIALQDYGNAVEAETLYRESLAMERKGKWNASETLNHMGHLFSSQGRLEEAASAYREALDIRREFLGEQHPYVAILCRSLGTVLYRQHKLAEAESVFRDELSLRRKQEPVDEVQILIVLNTLAKVLREQGKSSEAELICRDDLAIREKRFPDAWDTFHTRTLLGSTLLEQKKYQEAEVFLASAYKDMLRQKDRTSEEGQFIFETLQCLMDLCEATGRPDEADKWRNVLTDLQKTEAESEHKP